MAQARVDAENGPGVLLVPLQWLAWAGGTTVLLGLAAALGFETWRAWRDTSDILVIGVVVGVPSLIAGLGLAAMGVAVDRLGGVLRADRHGFRHCLFPVFPWPHVHGFALESMIYKPRPGEDTVAESGPPITHWTLVVGLDETMEPVLRHCRRRGRMIWFAPKVDVARHVVRIRCGLLRRDPHRLLVDLRAAGRRHCPERTFD